MQILDDPFYINDLYQKAVDDIANNRLKSKSKQELLDMRAVFIAHHELNKSLSTAQPFISMVESEIAGRKSNLLAWIAIWISIAGAIFTAIATWPSIREWFQSVPPARKDANFQSPKSNSTPSELPTKLPAPNGGDTNR